MSTAGIFRMEPLSSTSIAVATTDGTLQTVSISDDDTRGLSTVSSVNLSDSILTNVATCRDASRTVCCDSAGRVYVLDPERVVFDSWLAHKLPFGDSAAECWTVAWISDYLIGSGGDDFQLKLWDLRADRHVPAGSSKHDAGVTEILPWDEQCFVTGSYDEKIRLFDVRQLATPLSCLEMGGGVWRMCRRDCIVGAACMQAGYGFVKCENGRLELKYFETAATENPLWYGMDVVGDLFVSCSFYDKLLRIDRVLV